MLFITEICFSLVTDYQYFLVSLENRRPTAVELIQRSSVDQIQCDENYCLLDIFCLRLCFFFCLRSLTFTRSLFIQTHVHTR